MTSIDSYIKEKELEFAMGISLAEITDAEFIFNLRTQSDKNIFLKENVTEVKEQEVWLNSYKLRESSCIELYFVFEYQSQKVGTIRFIKRDLTSFESGSWFFLNNIPFFLPLRAEIFCKDIGFEFFGYDNCYFRVIKTNKQVLNYHKLFNPSLLREDLDYFYFLLNKKEYLSIRDDIVKYLDK